MAKKIHVKPGKSQSKVGFVVGIIFCMLAFSACGKKDTYEIEILIPAGSTAEYVFSDEEISPNGNKITISAGAGIADTAVLLKTVEVKEENAYEPTYLTQGMPVKMEAEKGAWYKIGVAMQNDSEKGPIAVSVNVDGVEVRIADQAEAWGITLTTEHVNSSGLTIRCEQSGGEATGELQTGSWYIVEQWTKENGWKEAARVPQEYDIAWTEEAYLIPKEDSIEWEVDWEWLYGKLAEGKYRIGKEIMDFRGTGDYDKAVYYAEFVISG